MKILLVGVSPDNYQVSRLKEEGSKKGVEIDCCYINDLFFEAFSGEFRAKVNQVDLKEYDLIYCIGNIDREKGKRRLEWLAAFNYLSKNKTRVINSFLAEGRIEEYLQTKNYLKQTELKIDFPRSIVFFDESKIKEALSHFDFPLIIKSEASYKGKLVYKVDNLEEAKKVVQEISESGEAIIFREFIPNDGDYRVFTVGYKVVGAMKRIPKEGNFKANISQGGRGEKVSEEVLKKIAPIAEKLSRALEIEIGGVDIVRDKFNGKSYVLEINTGPQIEGLEKYTRINVAEKIVDYFIRRINQVSKK